MPTRTLRQRQIPAATYKDWTHAIAYHSSAVTIFWLLFLFLTLGFAMLLLGFYSKMTTLEQDLALVNQSLVKTQLSVINLQDQMTKLNPPATIPTPNPLIPAATLPATSNTSPSSLLNRGALSPDGTKYAGYDDTTKGKLGVGVETLSDKKVRHVVIFNSKTESSGAELSSQQLSVRWVDSQTIQYDVLVTKSGQPEPTKETRTVQIYF